MKRGFLNSKKAKNRYTAMAVEAMQVSAKRAEPYVVFHFPSLELTQSKEPYSTCVFRPSTCDKITRTPGYYTPLLPPNPTDVFTKKVPNMGVGLFSKSSVNSRRVLFSERPLLVYPLRLPMEISGLSEEEVIKRNDLQIESILQTALSQMTKEDVDAYMGLSNCHPDRPSLFGIARTNVFGTGTDIEEAKEHAGYGVVGKLASRINHSCTPNVQMRFDIPTFSLKFIALRDVEAGEQLFYHYCEMYQSAKERRSRLASGYGFECQCKACVDATPKSDKLRKEMKDRVQKIIDGKEEMFANSQFGVRSLDPLLELEREIVKEGLDFGDTFSSLISVILEAYFKLKNRPKHIEYLNKWKRLTN